MDDRINPSHYSFGGIECIEALEACSSYEGFCAHLKLTAMAYLWRYEKKNGLEDLKKAQWYLDRLINTIHTNEAFPPLEPPPPEVEMECADGFCPMPGVRYDKPQSNQVTTVLHATMGDSACLNSTTMASQAGMFEPV